MKAKYKTEQEGFWAGSFGDEYIERNMDSQSIANRTGNFSKILSRTSKVASVLEMGTNIGHNLQAIRNINPQCAFGGIEINSKAADIAESIPNTTIFRGSILDFPSKALGSYDLTFTSGVLIHIDPAQLRTVYSLLYDCSLKYILIKEYYNPTPVEVNYRGHTKRLFKRDFAGEMLNTYPDLFLVDYGFQYHRDNNFPDGDGTWFLMEKK